MNHRRRELQVKDVGEKYGGEGVWGLGVGGWGLEVEEAMMSRRGDDV